MHIAETKICERDDAPALMSFLRANWSQTHIMANSLEYLDYFFYDSERKRYNIIYALGANGAIEGFIAFVPASFYDGSLEGSCDFLWLTNWLATGKVKTAGLALYARALSSTGCENVGILGLTDAAEAIYDKMGFVIGALGQYYMLRSESGAAASFIPLDERALREIEPLNRQLPLKSAQFIISKYLKSRYYKYYAYGTRRSAVIFRVQEFPPGLGKRCIRIVEHFGDFSVFKEGGAVFQELMREFDADYTDFYQYGIEDETLFSAGFEKNRGQLVLPNYFEPFVNGNIEIRFAYKLKQKKDGFTVYKGDGDRDFPRAY